MQRTEQVSEFKERLVAVNRVSKTVKGGRNMRFSALVPKFRKLSARPMKTLRNTW